MVIFKFLDEFYKLLNIVLLVKKNIIHKKGTSYEVPFFVSTVFRGSEQPQPLLQLLFPLKVSFTNLIMYQIAKAKTTAIKAYCTYILDIICYFKI